MKISLVVPVYNEEQYIAPCLESIAAQTVKPDEVLVVNNNSKDATVEIVKRYPFVTLLHEKKQGMTPTRNKGFNAARGDIIARCDADAKLLPTWIEQIKKSFESEQIDALSGPISFYDARLDTSFLFRFFEVMKPILNSEILMGPNMVLTQQMWNQVKNRVCLDDKKVHEDIDLSIHISEVGGKIKWDGKLLVPTSARRMKKNPKSFFAEYPLRFVKTLLYHKKDILSPFLIPNQ